MVDSRSRSSSGMQAESGGRMVGDRVRGPRVLPVAARPSCTVPLVMKPAIAAWAPIAASRVIGWKVSLSGRCR